MIYSQKLVKRNPVGCRKGYAVMALAVSASVLMASMALVLDIGFMEFYRRTAQIAADAGALAAARELQTGSSSSTVANAARQDTSINGFTDGSNGVTVTVNIPATSGSFSGDPKSAEVIVAKTMSTSFMGYFGVNSATIRARSVGSVGPSQYCIIALDPSAAGALTLQGNAVVNTPSCGVMVDSNNSQALQIGNSSCLTAKRIDVDGSYSGTCASPTPNTGVPPMDDPFATLSAPTIGKCDYTNYTTQGTAELKPGVYCGGITIKGNSGTITFDAGTYILDGGGLKVSGGNTLKGSEVTFYNTVTGTEKYDDIQITGGVSIQLSAPTSGTYEGILFYQDRTIATTSSQGDLISGDSSSKIDGVIYVPAGKVTYQGNSSTDGYTNIIAKTITFSGSSTVNNNYGSLSDGAPIRNTGLVE